MVPNGSISGDIEENIEGISLNPLGGNCDRRLQFAEGNEMSLLMDERLPEKQHNLIWVEIFKMSNLLDERKY